MNQPAPQPESPKLADWQQKALADMDFFFAPDSLGSAIYQYLIKKGQGQTPLEELAAETNSTPQAVASEIRGSQYMHQVLQVPFSVQVDQGLVSLYLEAQTISPSISKTIAQTRRANNYVMTPMPTASPRPRRKPAPKTISPSTPKKAVNGAKKYKFTSKYPTWKNVVPSELEELPAKDYSNQYSPSEIDDWLSKFKEAESPGKKVTQTGLPYREVLTVMLQTPHHPLSTEEVAQKMGISEKKVLETMIDLAKTFHGNQDPYVVFKLGHKYVLISQRPLAAISAMSSNWAFSDHGGADL